jgi:hypothetical protein
MKLTTVLCASVIQLALISVCQALCPAGPVPIVQKFPIQTTPLGLYADQSYVYVAYFADNHLYGYKRDTNGQIAGTSYADSVNISITLPGAVSSYLLFAQYNNMVYYGDYGSTIVAIDTTTAQVTNSFNLGQVKLAYVASDKYGLVYGLAYGINKGKIYVYNFTDPNNYQIGEFAIPSLEDKCAFDISDDDHAYISMSATGMNVFTITRDETKKPTGFVFQSSLNVTFPTCCCLVEMDVDKSGVLVGLGKARNAVETDFVPVVDKHGNQTIYCTPDLVTDLQVMWSDSFGYTSFTGGGNVYLTKVRQ